MELNFGYHQVWFKEEDTWKTTFKIRQGLYEWVFISFGLCNVPAMFMILMDDVLHQDGDHHEMVSAY